METGTEESLEADRMQNPLPLLPRVFHLLLEGRIRYLADPTMPKREDRGETFTAFRKVCVRPVAGAPAEPCAIFEVRFRFKNLPGWANRLLSLIPIPLIVAQPGFRSKTWYLGDKSGDFIGFYEFDTVADAEAYWDSLPLRMMRARAAEGTLSHRVKAVSRKGIDTQRNRTPRRDSRLDG
jgi:hypothetical protein